MTPSPIAWTMTATRNARKRIGTNANWRRYPARPRERRGGDPLTGGDHLRQEDRRHDVDRDEEDEERDVDDRHVGEHRDLAGGVRELGFPRVVRDHRQHVRHVPAGLVRAGDDRDDPLDERGRDAFLEQLQGGRHGDAPLELARHLLDLVGEQPVAARAGDDDRVRQGHAEPARLRHVPQEVGEALLDLRDPPQLRRSSRSRTGRSRRAVRGRRSRSPGSLPTARPGG